MKSNKYMCFVCDNDGHHYFIPVALRNAFYDLLEEMDSDSTRDVEFIDRFEKFRSMAPQNYMFTERVVLKEKG